MFQCCTLEHFCSSYDITTRVAGTSYKTGPETQTYTSLTKLKLSYNGGCPCRNAVDFKLAVFQSVALCSMVEAPLKRR
jgi:hypothetical protein